MTPPEHHEPPPIAEWLRKADEDLGVAERLLSDERPFTNAIGFHCQQAAEKYLKALLTRWGIGFPKTHVLAHLLRLVETRDPALTAALLDVIVLTPYGVALRYAGDYPDVSPAHAAEAVALARLVRDKVLPLLFDPPGRADD